ncbi:MAG: hypothetical protein VKL59_10130 [Nostocaceae cyanobacterium]|nr:hypothetical protein [Nostocaceae cyanobacterium]
MKDLEFIESISQPNKCVGANYVAVGTSTDAGYGYGSAGAFALAIGDRTATYTNTDVLTYLGTNTALTRANATASASASSGNNFTQVSLSNQSSYVSTWGGGISTNVTNQTIVTSSTGT